MASPGTMRDARFPTPDATRKGPYEGPAVLEAGFRPFFLMAGLFAVVVIPVWLEVYAGGIDLAGPFSPVDWHVHEMLFGYAAAVIAGFLFTAVPNWTGRMPARGWPLALLAALWLAGRLAVAGVFGLGPVAVMVIDAAFLAAIGAMIAVEIVAGRNWRNLKVVVPVLLFLAANVAFHLEAMRTGSAGGAIRLGFAVVLFLIMLIGGRIVPSFTRNWLARREGAALPAPFGRFDAVCLAAAVLAFAAWTGWPQSAGAAGLLVLAAALHLVRLARWRGWATWRSPLLAMLHVAYGFIPLGLAATAMAALGLLPAAAGFHLLGAGAVGTMTFAVMIRASKGHTGRNLEAGSLLTAGFALVAAAALVRSFLAGASIAGLSGITLAGLLWATGFAAFVWRVGPWLVQPRAQPRKPNPRPGMLRRN